MSTKTEILFKVGSIKIIYFNVGIGNIKCMNRYIIV